MSQQYEEPNHEPSTFYDRVYEAVPQDNTGRHTGQKISSQNPTVGQRLALAISSLSLLFIVSFIALWTLTSDIALYETTYPVVLLLFTIISLCFLGTVAINVLFNRLSQILAVGQRLALAITSLLFMLILSVIALLILMSSVSIYGNVVVSTLLFVMLFLCFCGIVGVNWLFNHKR